MDINGHINLCEDYVSFETAKLLKEKGFEQDPDYATSWYANQYYKNSCQGEWFEGEHQIIEDIDDKCNISYLSECGVFIPAPTIQMAMKFLREKFGIILVVAPNLDEDNNVIEGYYCMICKDKHIVTTICDNVYTYEQACEEGIKYALENLI